mgnify:CR=1
MDSNEKRIPLNKLVFGNDGTQSPEDMLAYYKLRILGNVKDHADGWHDNAPNAHCKDCNFT